MSFCTWFKQSFFVCLILTQGYMFSVLRESERWGREEGREGERERETPRREKHWSVSSRLHPDWGSNCNIGMCPDQGSNLQPFWCMRQCSNQLSHPARALSNVLFYFLKYFIYSFLERGEGRERERNIDVWEKHQRVASCMHPSRGPAGNPGMCADLESNLWHFDCRTTPNWLSHTVRVFCSLFVVEKISLLCLNMAFFVLRINVIILNTLANFTVYIHDLLIDLWVREGRIILSELFWEE